MATPQSVIKTLMASLDTTTLKGTAALDAAIKTCSSFSNSQAAFNRMISDLKSYISADSVNGWKNFLSAKCAINFNNTDTGAITGKDAGGSTIKTAESVIPESGSLENFTGSHFEVNGLTFTLEKSFSSLSPEKRFIWQALKTWWAKGALDLINASYGYSFNNSDVYFKNVTVSFIDNSSSTLRAWNHWYDTNSDGKVDKVVLAVNMKYYKDIDLTNPNGYSSAAGFYLDKTLAHELTHTIMHAKILNSTDLPLFAKEGLAELTIGIDDERASDISYLAKNPTVLLKNLEGTYSAYSYEAGYMFFRYLAKQAATGGSAVHDPNQDKSIVGTAGSDSINNSLSGATIQTYSGNDKVYNTGTKTKIYAGAGIDSVYNHATNVTIDGGNDADYISNFNGSVSIYGGAGNDSLFNSSVASGVTIDGGNDADYISNKGNKVSIHGGAGIDSIYNNGASVTVDGGNDADYISNRGNKVSIRGGAGNDSIYTYGANVTIDGGYGADRIVNWGSAASLFGGTGNDTIYGNTGNDTISGGSNDDKLFGDAGNDALYGGDGNDSLWGGDGNDSLWGGKGNDTLYGGSGADKFIYNNGDGKDVIVGFDKNDMLQITGTFTTAYSASSKVLYFKVGDTAGAIQIRNINTSIFNINGNTYQLNNNKLVPKS